MLILRRFGRITLRLLAGILLFFILYSIAGYGLMYVPVNSDFTECRKDAVEIYIRSNDVHTDIVVPIKNELKDWSEFVDAKDTRYGNTDVSYVSFGWGDKGFYLHTKTWADLKFSTAFKAAFWLSESAMHVVFHDSIRISNSCKKVCISKESYSKLVKYIEDSFDLENTKPRLISNSGYWENDSFYEARGRYNLFYTCNTWVNCGLKAADLKACLWTPFNKGILYQYQEVK